MKEEELYEKIKELITKNQYYSQIKNKIDRESILNDTYIYIWQKINENKLSNDWEEIKGYCFISCRNNCLNYLRQKQKERSILSIEDAIGTKYDSYEIEELDEDIIRKVKWVFNTLPFDIDKKIMRMRLEGYQLKEIAQELDIDQNRIIMINKSIRNFLRNKWEDKDTPRYLPRLKNRVYVVMDIETGEKVFKSTVKRVISNKYSLDRKNINDWIDTGRVFNEKLIIKTEYFRNESKKINLK